MSNRPISITMISWLFILAGGVGLAYHSTEFKTLRPFQYDVALVCVVRLLAIVGGVCMLRGHNWARWLLLAWLVYHVLLSAFHAFSGLIMHTLLLIVIAFFLFRPRTSAYFHSSHSKRTPRPSA